ncbi:MAG: NAD(P)-binding protein, partial [Planctomycetes bacterium]|nr:NAD(P)-binding protein [Planctomycetota bacterium]
MASLNDLDLSVNIGSVKMRNPFMVSSGPTTKSVEQLVRADETGWGGVCLKLCFDPFPYINKEPRYGYWADEGILAFSAEKRINIDEGIKLAVEGRKATKNIAIFANITYDGDKGIPGWVNMAKRFEDAGVDGIELNMCCPNMSFNLEVTGEASEMATGASLGQNEGAVAAIVEAIKKVVSVPLIVKITPEGGRVAQVANASVKAGANAVGTNANMLAVPPFDVENPDARFYPLQDEPSIGCFCGPWLKPLALRNIYEMRNLIGEDITIATSGGVSNWEDAVQFFLFGADIVQISTETLVSGFGFMPDLLANLKDYLIRHGHKHPREIRGYMERRITPATELTIYPGHAKQVNENLAAPCKVACPNNIPAQAYVRAIGRGNFEEAFRHITSRDPLQSICGYICNHECETECTRGEIDEPIRIRDLKRFVLEKARKEGWKRIVEKSSTKRSERVGVVGSGPAGISCAFDLARAGYDVTVFEAEKKTGGMLRGVIPSFRMPESILDAEIKALETMGVK